LRPPPEGRGGSLPYKRSTIFLCGNERQNDHRPAPTFLKAVREIQEGKEPPHLVRDPAENDFVDLRSLKGLLLAGASWRELAQVNLVNNVPPVFPEEDCEPQLFRVAVVLRPRLSVAAAQIVRDVTPVGTVIESGYGGEKINLGALIY
jgi:hypothetical protein